MHYYSVFHHLVQEVIKNGFEKDLLPTSDNIDIGIVNYLDDIISQCNATDDYHINDRLEKSYINILSQKYKIFEKLNDKMEHPQHKQMGYPLLKCEMFALLLYCNGDCNYDLCRTQRNGYDCVQKK